ncbi:helicase [Aureococcus anophagefferens]|nr:helicase [Aureococcus anophagefferens]
MDMLKQLEAKLGADSELYKKLKAQLMLKELEAKLGADSDVYKKVKAQIEAQQQSSRLRRGAGARAAAARRARAKVSRTMEIDGHTVLCENNYDVTASHYEYGERPADPPRPAPAKKPRRRAARRAPPTAGELKRAAQNEALRAEMALAAPRRAAFFDGHRELLAPFTSGHLESLDWFADRHERCGALPCVLGDEMGLGKTLQTIAYLAWLKFEKRLPGAALVICPLSVLSTWLGECARWCPRLRAS